MDAAKQKRLASLGLSPEAVTKMFGRFDAISTPRRTPVGFTARATVYRAISRAAPSNKAMQLGPSLAASLAVPGLSPIPPTAEPFPFCRLLLFF